MRRFLFLCFILLFPSFLRAQSEWPIYAYGNSCSFRVPKTMELRDPESYTGKFFVGFKDFVQMYDLDEIVFQQQGLNSDDIEVIRKASPLYARIIIKTIEQDDINLTDVSKLTQSEIKEIDKDWKEEVKSYFPGKDFIWYPVVRKRLGGKLAMVTRYQRPSALKNSNSPVYVEEYKFFLKGKMIRFTLSYRISESSIWKDDFSKIMSTLSFN